MIIFNASHTEDSWRIYAMDNDGSNIRHITLDVPNFSDQRSNTRISSSDTTFICRSPDERWIASVLDDATSTLTLTSTLTGEAAAIELVPPDGEHFAEVRTIEWSPDSTKVTYIADYSDVWVCDIANPTPFKVAELSYFWLQYAWSSDSQSIVFVIPTDEDGPETSQGQLMMTKVTTLQSQYLADVANFTQWCWLPDHCHLIYIAHEAGYAAMYSLDVTNGSSQTLIRQDERFKYIFDLTAP